MSGNWGRRQVLALGAVMATAGCVAEPPTRQGTAGAARSTEGPAATTTAPTLGEAGPTTAASDTPGTTANGTSTPASTSPSSASPPLWQPDPNDVSPEAKAAATRHIQGLTGQPPAEVIDVQYGGILANQASVLVVTHQWGASAATGTTYDVRLVRAGSSWTVTDVLPSHPGAASAPSAAASQVLANPAISLPPAARADIASGVVHDTVLKAMLTLAQSYRIGVSVVRSGHPTYVFGTSRLSDHPFGRAFDTWRINDHPVVAAATPRTLITGYMEAVADTGSYNIGGPYSLSGSAFFSDPTHHDHVHAGYQR